MKLAGALPRTIGERMEVSQLQTSPTQEQSAVSDTLDFPLLHEPDALRVLFWKTFKQFWLPVSALSEYFGPRSGAYFRFLDSYTRSLLVPSVIATVLATLRWGARPSTAARILARICISAWSLQLAWRISQQQKQEGAQLVIGENTYRQWGKIAATFTGTCAVGAFVGGLIIASLNWQGYINSPRSRFAVPVLQRACRPRAMFDASHTWKGLIPMAVHSLSMNYLNKGWAVLAAEMSAWDGTGTSGTIVKRLVLEGLDGFMPIFWLAVVRRDREGLAEEMQGLYICDQARRMAVESLLPYLFISPKVGGRVRSLKDKVLSPKQAPPISDGSKMLLQMSARSQPSLDWPSKGNFKLATGDELNELDEFEEFDDWLEMLLQFAYISWLGHDALYMLPASFMSNMFEARSDMFKLCCCMQRPQPEPEAIISRDVATWHGTMRLIAYLGAAMNAADAIRLLVTADAAPKAGIIVPNMATFELLIDGQWMANLWKYANPKRLARVFRNRRLARFFVKLMRRSLVAM